MTMSAPWLPPACHDFSAARDMCLELATRFAGGEAYVWAPRQRLISDCRPVLFIHTCKEAICADTP